MVLIGAQAVNGAMGVNWLPEPSLSVFLANWLGGQAFGDSVERSYRVASRLLGLVWRPQLGGPHEKIASARWGYLATATCAAPKQREGKPASCRWQVASLCNLPPATCHRDS